MFQQLPHDHGDHRYLTQTIELLEYTGNFQIIADLFKRLGDTTRLRTFWFLCHYEECVVNIAAALEMSSPAVSHHLKILKEDGLIESRRKGKEVYYFVARTAQCELLHQMIELIMRISCPELSVLPSHLDHADAVSGQKSSETSHGIPVVPKKPHPGECKPVHTPGNYHAQETEIIHQIHEYLTLHMDQHCTVESLARQFLINATTLKILFKKEYGNSVAAHIREHRMEKAADLLTESSLSLGEIALSVGYKSQSKFTAAFKEYYHMLPKEYRQKCRA